MNVRRAVAAGMVATAVLTALWLVEPSIGLPNIAVGQILSSFMSVSVARLHVGVAGGWLVHLAVGVAYALLYAWQFDQRLPGTPVVRGAIFGFFIFLLAEALFMPLVGAGPFSRGDSALLVGSLLGHLAYGITLGWIYDIGPALSAPRPSAGRFAHVIPAMLAVITMLVTPVVASATEHTARRTNTSTDHLLDPMHSVAPVSLQLALGRVRAAVPGYSRQTGLACIACHYQFPQLTPFGRLFKLNGYTLSGLPAITAGDSTHVTLKLPTTPFLSAMIVTSLTHTEKAQPASENNSASFPEQASVFLGGAITPNMGAFTQFTYAAQDGSFGVDNIDVRYARHVSWMEKDLLLGATLNNNPTSQDVWNTVPAWSFPFMSSSLAPAPAASTLLEGAFAQQVVGLGGYALYDNLLYAEFTAYRSAQQGTHAPLDSSSHNTIAGVLPYARVALQHMGGTTYGMIGGFGLLGARVRPAGIIGATDHYTTLGVDAQVEHKLNDAGAMLIGRASWIHESRTLDASFADELAQDPTSTLHTLRANLSWQPGTHLGATLGYFNVGGSSDTLLYAPAELTGSRTGRPNSSGLIGELAVNPWLNARVALQYVWYHEFNGSSDAYDLAGGRSASANNTLYLFSWIAF